MRLATAISWRAHAANDYRTKRAGAYVRWISINTANVGPIYAILGIYSASIMIGSTQVAEKPRVAAVMERAANKVWVEGVEHRTASRTPVKPTPETANALTIL